PARPHPQRRSAAATRAPAASATAHRCSCLSNSPSDLIGVLQALLPVALRRRRLPDRAGMPPAERGGLAALGRENAARARSDAAGWPERHWTWRGVRVYDGAPGQRGPAQSAPSSLGLPPRSCSLPHCASAEKKVTPCFDECGRDTSETE